MDYGINLYPYFNQDSLYNAYLYQYANPNFANISPVQYGYQNVQNPSFKGSLTTPSDTVSFSATNEIQPQKKGMSKGARVGIGAVTVAGLGTLVYLLSKGKIGAKQAKELAEHIEFKPAKTVEEAKKFAEEKFGVYYHDIDNVEVVNYFNEWVTGLHNKCNVINRSSYPKFIANNSKALNIDEPFALHTGAMKLKGQRGYLMEINMSMFSDFKNAIDKMMQGSTAIKKDVNGRYTIIDKAYQTKEFKDFINRINNISSKTTFSEKIRLISDMKGFQDGGIVNGQIKKLEYSNFYLFNHELGHLRHQDCAKNFEMMQKIEEFEKVGKPVSDITQEFVTDKKIQETARKVSDYATESPLEFVAETFANMQDGRTFSDDVMSLYKKYGGPEL